MTPVQNAYLKIHVAVVLFGFTAILGGLIELSALVLVWWRMLFTSISLIFMVDFRRMRKTINRKLAMILVGNGVIIALHWLCFYASIKLANASVALICLASASLFASLIEPLVFKRKISKLEIFMGLLIIPAMVLIVQQLDFSMMTGVWVGIAAALLSAIFATINKLIVSEAHSFDITLVELGSGWLFLSLILPVTLVGNADIVFWPDMSDLLYLLILAFLCTTLAFILSLQSLKYLSAFNSTLIVNLEPVYGIVMAWLILRENEQLNHIFYWGVALIMLIVFSYPILKRRLGYKLL